VALVVTPSSGPAAQQCQRVHVIQLSPCLTPWCANRRPLWSSIYRDQRSPAPNMLEAWKVLQRDLPDGTLRRMVDLLFIAHEQAL